MEKGGPRELRDEKEKNRGGLEGGKYE